jgi:hypothetical protein
MTDAELRKQSWDFFQVQAGQRLTTFNFYIALSSLLTGGLAATLKNDIDIPLAGFAFGLLLTLFSLIFWKLDQRNRYLIKSAEQVLKFFESRADYPDEAGKPHVVKRFLREEFETNELRRRERSWLFWRNYYSYTDCFTTVFLAFGSIGAAGGVYSLLVVLSKIPCNYRLAC